MNIERMRTAVAYWLTIPDTQWNMDLYYFSPNRCGCALGHLAHNEVAGFYMSKQNTPATLYLSKHNMSAEDITGFCAAQKVFEITNWESHELFMRVGRKIEGGPTHKQIFFLRLDKLLAARGIPMSTIYGPSEREATGPAEEPCDKDPAREEEQQYDGHPCYEHST